MDHRLDPDDRAHERELVGHRPSRPRRPRGRRARPTRCGRGCRASAGSRAPRRRRSPRRSCRSRRRRRSARCRRGRGLRSGRARTRAPCGSASTCPAPCRWRAPPSDVAATRVGERVVVDLVVALPRGERRRSRSRSAGARARCASGRAASSASDIDFESSISTAMRFGSRATWRSSTAGSRNTHERADGAAAPRRPIISARRHAGAPRLARHDERDDRDDRGAAEREAEPAPRRQEHPAVLVEVAPRRRGEPHGQRDERLAGERAERARARATPSTRAEPRRGRGASTSTTSRARARSAAAIASAIRTRRA